MPGAASGPSVKGLHHAAFRCRDSEETRRFYEDFLGLPLVEAFEIGQTATGRSTSVLHTFFEMGDGSCMAFFEAPGGRSNSRPSTTSIFTSRSRWTLPSSRRGSIRERRSESRPAASRTTDSSVPSTSATRTGTSWSSPPGRRTRPPPMRRTAPAPPAAHSTIGRGPSRAPPARTKPADEPKRFPGEAAMSTAARLGDPRPRLRLCPTRDLLVRRQQFPEGVSRTSRATSSSRSATGRSTREPGPPSSPSTSPTGSASTIPRPSRTSSPATCGSRAATGSLSSSPRRGRRTTRWRGTARSRRPARGLPGRRGTCSCCRAPAAPPGSGPAPAARSCGW